MGTMLAFGTYIPGNSPVHKTNAQVKVILTCVLSIVAFFVNTWLGLGLLVAATVILYILANVPVLHALRGLKPVAFILVFTILAHVFTMDVTAPAQGGTWSAGSLGLEQAWAISGTFGVTLDGAFQGCFFALRIALLVAACCLLSFTTSMTELTDGLLSLLKPLAKVKVPAEDVAMVVSIALRFVPTITEEANGLVNSQKSRCSDFDGGGVVRRTKAWIPVFIPLFVRLFKRADELACAMDARCYRGRGRTHMRASSPRGIEAIVGMILAILVIVVAILF